jgi:NADH dehydrogenase
MKVLVTGGTGVVGRGAVTALLARGHTVRLFSRHAAEDVKQWEAGVEPWPGDIGERADVDGAAAGCDAVLHVVGIVDESPPDLTFDRINVEGTRLILREAERAGASKLVYVSSLGAPEGSSAYHRSKARGEALVRQFSGRWVIVRPGNVYGPGDEVISLLLKMVRTLPAIPVLGDGEQEFQPVWYEDVAEALAIAVERDDLAGRELDLAGVERTSMNDLVDRLKKVTGRDPARLPLPQGLAALGLRLADMVGIDTPVNESQLTMLREGNVIARDEDNALVSVFGVAPTRLDVGLERLADALPEQLPADGIGALERKRFWADIAGSRLGADELFARFRLRFAEIMPEGVGVGAEPGTPARPLAEGETLTLSLPLRGHCQVRVAELTDNRLTLVTLAGHPLAGAVRFLAEQRADHVRFEVQTYDRAATLPDLVVMRTVGGRMQNATWSEVVERVVRESGGTAVEEVQHDRATLDDERAERVNDWLRDLVLAQRAEDQTPPAAHEGVADTPDAADQAERRA